MCCYSWSFRPIDGAINLLSSTPDIEVRFKGVGGERDEWMGKHFLNPIDDMIFISWIFKYSTIC